MAGRTEVISELSETIDQKIQSGEGIRNPWVLRQLLGSGYYFLAFPPNVTIWINRLRESTDPQCVRVGNSFHLHGNPFSADAYLESCKGEQRFELHVFQRHVNQSGSRLFTTLHIYKLYLPQSKFSLDSDNAVTLRTRIDGLAVPDHLKATNELIKELRPFR